MAANGAGGASWRAEIGGCGRAQRSRGARSGKPLAVMGRGGGLRGGCEGTGAAAGVTPKVEEASRGSRQAVSSPRLDGWKGGAPLTNRL